MKIRPWTEEDDKELSRMRSEGISPAKIAKKLKRSRSAICQRAIRTLDLPTLRAPKQFWTEKEIATLHRLFRTHRCSAIAHHLGRTAQSVQDRAKREGLYRRDFPL